MNKNQKLASGKILIIAIIFGIGGIIMSYGIYFFTTDSWMPPKSEPKVGTVIPNLGLFEIDLHNDYYGIVPGSYLQGGIRLDIAVPNDTKVQVTFPGGLIPSESNYTAGLGPANQIPLNFLSRSGLQTNSFHTDISGLVYNQPGDFDAKLIITRNNKTQEYTINDVLSIQPYSYYESQRNENISRATLYFTAGLVLISTSPVFIQLFENISELRRKSTWENWMKENRIQFSTKNISSRQKIGYFLLGIAIGGVDYLGLFIGSRYEQSTTVAQVIVSITLAIASPLVYVTILILLIFSTFIPIFFKVTDPRSRPIYISLAGLATSLAIFDLILITTNICNAPLYHHFGKCVNQ